MELSSSWDLSNAWQRSAAPEAGLPVRRPGRISATRGKAEDCFLGNCFCARVERCNPGSDCFVWIENLRELLGVQIRLSVMTD